MYVDFHHNDLAQDEAAARGALAESIGFDEADLAMNKAGKLSTPQMTRLSFQVLGPFIGLVGTAIGLVTLAITLWTVGPMIATRVRLMLTVGKYLGVGVGALFFGLIAFIMKLILTSGRVFQFIVDLSQGKAVSVTGRMNASKAEDIEDGLNTITRKKTESYNCVVKGEYFGIKEETYSLLLDRSGSNYTAYVTPRSRFLLALEPAVADMNGRDPFKLEYKP